MRHGQTGSRAQRVDVDGRKRHPCCKKKYKQRRHPGKSCLSGVFRGTRLFYVTLGKNGCDRVGHPQQHGCMVCGCARNSANLYFRSCLEFGGGHVRTTFRAGPLRPRSGRRLLVWVKYPSYNASARAFVPIAKVHGLADSTLSTEPTADATANFTLLRFFRFRRYRESENYLNSMVLSPVNLW